MSAYEFHGFVIPAHMVESLRDYVERRYEPGGFLMAVLENDLKGACGRADMENLRALPAYAAYLVNEMPSVAQGSKERVQAWLRGAA